MEQKTTKAISIDTNSFGQTTTTDLGFEKTYYKVSEEEFLKTDLPDAQYYGTKANDITRKLVEFKDWEDSTDCKYIEFDVVNGNICNVKDVAYDVYKSCLNFVEVK